MQIGRSRYVHTYTLSFFRNKEVGADEMFHVFGIQKLS